MPWLEVPDLTTPRRQEVLLCLAPSSQVQISASHSIPYSIAAEMVHEGSTFDERLNLNHERRWRALEA
jgi:hypothetical protein